MRRSLLHPIGQARHTQRRRGHGHQRPKPEAAQRTCDPAVKRVREAGGPVDRASYACCCGYLFDASVSTTVSCPHCGADQAW
jgi:hypothetical protein